MIAIVDYGMGNLRSVEKALGKLGHTGRITANPAEIRAAPRVILPGVGAFGAAMERLRAPLPDGDSLEAAILDGIRSGRPFLGICLGMQLLMSASEEMGRHRGLGVVPGGCVRFDAGGDPALKVPHMGWNTLRFPRRSPLFEGLEEGASVYFVHSYHCVPEDSAVVTATCEHGGPFAAALSTGNVHATQFHPEKSGAVGLRILDRFARL